MKSILLYFIFGFLGSVDVNAQTITGISSAGAVSAGSGSSFNLKWTTSTTTTSMIHRIDLTLANYKWCETIF